MEDKERKRFKLLKAQCKGTVTKQENYLKDYESSLTLEDLEVRLQVIQDVYTKYNDYQLQLKLLGDTTVEDDFEERVLILQAKMNRLIKGFLKPDAETTIKDNECSYRASEIYSAKLPALDIPIFDGRDITLYKPFIEMFEAMVHEDDRIPKIQKLCFLKKYLRGVPLQLIDSLPIVGDSYTSALKLLQNRYDNKALLVNNHITYLIDMPTLLKGAAQQLREFVAKVRQHLIALKNLEQPVDQWNAILSNILLHKIDSYTVRLYHTERDTTQIPTVDSILNFLDKRSASMEASPMPTYTKFKSKPALTLVSTDTKTLCILCSQVHKLHLCSQFLTMCPTERLKYVQSNNLCNICLMHHTKKCRYNFKCGKCKASHNTLIHQEKNPPGLEQQKESSLVSLHSLQSNNKSTILPTAKVLVSDVHGNKYVVRALLDSGSQTSFCTTALAKKLKLHTYSLNKNIITLGGHGVCTMGINLTLFSRVQDYKINVSCSIIDNITVKLPQIGTNFNNFFIPKGLVLADDEFNIPGDISILLSADIFFAIILDGKIEGNIGDPIYINTRLGYIVSACSHMNSYSTTLAMHTVDISNSDLDKQVKKFWEAEKVPEVYLETMPEHEYSMKVFQESTVLQNSKFQVKLPLKITLQDIDPSNSYAIALQRLYNLQRKFTKNHTYFTLYKNFIQEYLDLGHAKIINMECCNTVDQPLYFLPHHAVLRLDKQTNKLRVVMDGSAKTKKGYSLNDILCNGPVLQKSLFDIILLFRTFKYTFQCDIRHMYRNISIHPDHRCLQNILWFDKNNIQCLQLQTVTYGLTSSAFLATACLFELAKRYQTEFPLASKAIFDNSYIDDIQTGCDTLQEANLLKIQLQDLMKMGGFTLHKFALNDPQLLQGLPESTVSQGEREIDQDRTIHKILGLSYDAATDVFKVSGRRLGSESNTAIKRNVLSSISRLYDPMGFVGPVTVKAKLFLQQLWQYNLEWDIPLPSELVTIWEDFYSSLISMPQFNIKRYLQTAEAEMIELLGYCDASANAYGCCIFIKVKINGIYYLNFLCSKSKVAPLHSKLTIPKLELNGALLLAKLMNHIRVTLNIANITLFCDSKIVLGWLSSSSAKVPAYIGNRINQISKLTDGMSWCYIPGLLNPADILSRGCDPIELLDNKLWKQGLDCVNQSSNYNFYMSEIEIPIVNKNSQVNDSVIYTNIEKIILPLLENYSSLYRTIRIMVLMLRFVKKCKKEVVNSGRISVEEIRCATTYLIRGVQIYYFADEIKFIKENKGHKSSLNSLTPFIDEQGILRVGGRLHNANLSFSQKFPIILPKHCHLTKLIIRQEHIKLMHGGLKIVLSSLSQTYYIINAVREIKSVIHKCLTCCRYRATVAQQLMGSLPSDRVNPARTFEKVGLDYGGPFDIKQSTKRNSTISKGYIAVFVCFVTKAIHMEVVSDMTTDTFLSALKRFIARRGNPSDIFCDNASTFRGANNKLNELYKLHTTDVFKNSVNTFTLQRGIQFHFIPKYSPSQGGLWEAAVKSAKHHLKRVSSFKIFTYEQFNTIIIEIESILNSRPLTSMSQDVSDFSVLTPGHFLIGCALTSIPQPSLTDIPSNRLKFWRCCEQVRQNFWKVWSNDYLSTLNKRTKWLKDKPNLKNGLLVLLKNDNAPPLQWPMGRIARVFSGKDSKVRVVEAQTADKKLHCRAISKIVVLPIET